MRFASQHFAILGAGRSGLGAARLARLHGAEVTIFDEGDKAKQVEDFRCVLGQPARDLVVKLGDFDKVIISPGLDEHWPLPKKFTDAGVPLVGETEFAFQLTDMALAAITGTNGKSTCTELIATLFNGCGMKSVPCGNHGMSLSEVVASGVHYDVLALEISSFQLETIRDFRARASLWLNFAPDHLDRYPDMESYYKAKARIFENVTADDIAIVRAGESVSSGAAQRWTFSAYGAEADYTYRDGAFYHHGEKIGSARGLKLRGKHNMENVLAALMTGRVYGLQFADMLKAMESYEPPRHRCELVRTLHDREYINDSKATNLHALEACLRSQERPIVLIAGGKDKELDYSPLRSELNGQVRAMVLIGEIAQQLKQTFGDLLPCQCATDMADAVQQATALSQPGDAIILSPGTSSFDMYTGYAQRGEVFREAVAALN
ncbi:UDP-N-acetylmuramoyl-L-alanine--D-glutamate ligase [Prosthecobacter vanneervenii]|uniref:UDP-N-acetylmuramoylalanine--D-glutamate ligase n=1 Tax=Prosthecobacter vanneervenii TaxID=48466 RepID=A0A7W8DL83_9BACT|nr:UDP-N-acetylmuramoyl-L-alanine--D-glutamate ligase [Prosthecobacter vanneervenii]MBB5034099.1 UDP-N-acetylmuramoylalanine--D-glutamate ligase [Prosthecobacter vanneervenii]